MQSLSFPSVKPQDDLRPLFFVFFFFLRGIERVPSAFHHRTLLSSGVSTRDPKSKIEFSSVKSQDDLSSSVAPFSLPLSLEHRKSSFSVSSSDGALFRRFGRTTPCCLVPQARLVICCQNSLGSCFGNERSTKGCASECTCMHVT